MHLCVGNEVTKNYLELDEWIKIVNVSQLEAAWSLFLDVLILVSTPMILSIQHSNNIIYNSLP